MTLRWDTQERSARLIAWIVVAVFVLATNYCAYETVTNGHARADGDYQRAPAGHHDESSSSHDHAACCVTLQAVVTQQPSLLLAGASQPLLQEIPLQSVHLIRSVDLSLAPSGLSPPAREPTPARPFYRTTFANHAPPAYLA